MYISKRNGYVYLTESYRDEFGDVKNRIIKSYGRYDTLYAEDPDFFEKLQIEAKKYTENIRNDEKEKTNLTAERVTKFISNNSYKGYHICNFGYLFYKSAWDELDLDAYFQNIHQKVKGENFNLRDTIFFTALVRLLADNKTPYLGRFNLNNINKSIQIINSYKIDLIKYINDQISNLYDISNDIIYYYVTNYHFTNIHNKVRNIGYSTDNMVTGFQVVMGFYTDKEGLPIGFELFTGDTFDHKTLITALKKTQKQFNANKVVVIGDYNLNFKKNLYMIKKAGFEYVVSKRIKDTKQNVKNKILSIDNFNDTVIKNSNTILKSLIIDHSTEVKVRNKDKVVIPEKVIITWSKESAIFDQQQRATLINKAMNLTVLPSKLQSLISKGKNVKLKTGIQEISLDSERIKEDEKWDGYYGIQTSLTDLNVEEVIRIYYRFQKVMDAFKVIKKEIGFNSDYYWSDSQIKFHFVINFIAYLLQEIIEYKLEKRNVNYNTHRIKDIIKKACILILGNRNESIFLKQEVNDNKLMDEVIQALNFKNLKTTTLFQDMKEYLRYYNIKL